MSAHAVSRANSLVALVAAAAGMVVGLSLGGADGAMVGFGAALVTLLAGGALASRLASARI
jgi:hypothetical protein